MALLLRVLKFILTYLLGVKIMVVTTVIFSVLERGWGLGELLSSNVARSVRTSSFGSSRRMTPQVGGVLQRSSQWGIVFGWLEYCR